jgi:hypothetical protein
LIACFIFFPQVSNSQTPDEYQVQFELGISAMNAGDYNQAIGILEDLFVKTNSPRVKLELARAAYLSGDLSTSKKLFYDVLELNPPMMVRERIGIFLEEIALSAGKVEVSAGFVQDSNPRAVTNNRIISLYGMNFLYDPGFDTSPQWGMGYNLVGAKAFGDQKRLLIGVSINGAKFEDYFFDRTSLQTYAMYRVFDQPNVKLKTNYEQFYYGGSLLYTAPSVSAIHSKDFMNGAYWLNEVKFSKLDYPDYSYLNGPLNSITTSYGYPVVSNGTLGFEVGLDRAKANESPYSFKTQTFGLVGNLYLTDLFLKIQLKVNGSNRIFDDFDPLFGVIRQDRKKGAYLNLVKTDWKVYGLAPSLDLGYEINDSNIDLYTYTRSIIGLNFRKVY